MNAPRARVPFRYRLSVQQTRIAVSVALLIGIFFAGTQIVLDASTERENLIDHAKSILDYADQPAARAAYRLDILGTQELVDSLLSDPAVVKAEIFDDLGDQLSVSHSTANREEHGIANLFLGTKDVRFERKLFIANGEFYVGTISIELDPVTASPGFTQRFYSAILSGLGKSTLLSILLLLIFHTMITKRVNRLASSITIDLTNEDLPPNADELDHLDRRIHAWTSQLADALRQAERANTAKSVFLAGMSHEMRTPLNAVIGFAEALELGVGVNDKEKRNEYLHNIAQSGRQLDILLGDILDFSKIEAGRIELKLQAVCPKKIILENLLNISQIATAAGLKLTTNLDTDNEIIADISRFRQIMINFVSNAAKYNTTGGIIEVGCNMRNDGKLRFSVYDDGDGISPEQHNEIFEHFNRGKNVHPNISGAGLGLAICKQLATAMKGEIGLDQHPVRGVTFWVDFPLAGATS